MIYLNGLACRISSKCGRLMSSNNIRNMSSTTSDFKKWKVYLSGEIHSDWREVIQNGISADTNLANQVTCSSPNTSHEDSDDCGAYILGMEEKRPNWDKIGANMNALRTKSLIEDADIVVVETTDVIQAT